MGTTKDGTPPEAIADLARGLGLATQAREGCTLDDLAHAISNGAPCICSVRNGDTGHYVVARGVGPDTVSVMDPLKGNVDVPRDEWMRNWWDEAGGRTWDHWAVAVGAPS